MEILAPYAGIIGLALFILVFGLLVIAFTTRGTAKKERNIRANYEGGSYRGYSKNHGQYTNR